MSGRNVTFASDVNGEHAYENNENVHEGDEGEEQVIGMADDEKEHDAAHNHASADTNSIPKPASTMSIFCPNCGSTSIEQHDASGASVCTECGVVVEENAIVSAVEFVEGAGGASSMVGQFVSATSSKAYTGGPGGGGPGGGAGGRYGFSRDSRETTLANGRRRIQEVASRLRLGTHFVDAAHRLFTIAVERNFVQGRRTTHVVAACLYIACRQEKSQHMLIDFSDALQVNVYTLGTCFLKFRRLLGLKLEIIDPALYIYRFAAHLDLDEKANAVSLTALRLVARMKRDWIVAGRRPAGICAAALLIASRAHGFSRHHQDVTRILRVCGWTVTNRVKEFEHTPSAALTLEQFQKVDLDVEADPPVFRRNKFREARAKAIRQGDVELLESGALDDKIVDGKKADRWRQPGPVVDGDGDGQLDTEIGAGGKMGAKKVQLQTLYKSLAKELLPSDAAQSAIDAKRMEEPAVASTPIEDEDENDVLPERDKTTAPSSTSLVIATTDTVPAVWKKAYPLAHNGRALVLPDEATPEEQRPPSAPTETQFNLSEWKAGMPDSMEDEFANIFRDNDEEREKEVIFNKINKDYLVTQKRKESERLSVEASLLDREKTDAAQAESSARYNTRKKKSRKADGSIMTTEEQLLAAVAARKVSRKINYDALSSIFDEDGSFSTDVVDDTGNASVATEEGLY